MRVGLIGPVSARSGAVSLRLGGLKQRAVFALLALNAGRVVPLDRFVDELWPEEPPARATLGLQSYVSRLRRELAAVAVTDPDVPRLLTRPPGWQLDLDPALVDIPHFEDLVTRARHTSGAQAAALLAEARRLWCGEPLADLQAVPFARAEATRLTELRLDAEELALEAALVAGDAEAAVIAGGRFVAENPFRERGWRALALGLYRTGRQSEALAAVARLRRTLADELGLDPSPETAALEGGMLRHDPALTFAPHPEPVAGPAHPEPVTGPAHPEPVTGAPPAAERSDDRLLGRDAALGAVDHAVARACSGRGSLLVLAASAGAGKTTLLRAAADRTVAAGGNAVAGSGVGIGAMPALWPWVTIVRAVAELLPGDEVVAAGGAAGQALTLMRSGGPAGADRSQTRLFRGVVDLLLAARARGPLTVLLDDLQWVDRDSRTLLALAVDELVGHGVLFAVAVRTEEPGTEEVDAMLRGVRRDAVVRVPVPGLGAGDVAEILCRLSGRPPDAEVAAAIHRRTLGNPFFVGEVVRLLVSEQRLHPAAVDEALPAEVEEVLRRRLERLPQQTVALLTVVALAGGPIGVDTLAAVTGLDADAVLDACESALLAELLVEDGPGFGLRHDLVRQTLVRGVSQARRVRLHARLADALRTRGALTTEEVVAVARHLVLAEPTVGPAAVPYLAAAADDAMNRNCYREAERFLDQALDLAGRAPDREEGARLAGTVRGRMSVVRTWSGRQPATTTLDDIGPDLHESPAGWVNILITRALTGRYAEAVEEAERALTEAHAPAAAAAAHFVAGWGQCVRGLLDESDRHFQAFEAIGGLRMPAVGVAAAGYAALVAHCRGDEAAADRHEKVARARVGTNEAVVMEADLYAAWLRAMRGDAEGCRIWAGACAAAADLGPLYGIHAAVLLAWADAVLGDPEGARRCDEAYDRFAASGVLMFAPLYLLLRAEAHARTGRTDRAAELVAESAARSAELGDVCRAPRLLRLAEDRVQTSRKP